MTINSTYFDYGESLAKYNFPKAEFYLNKYIEEEGHEMEDFEVAQLYQLFGNSLFDYGNTEGALEKYLKSVSIAPYCLLTKMKYAEFLAIRLQNHKLAKPLLLEIIDECNSNPFEESESDFGSDYYVREAIHLLKK